MIIQHYPDQTQERLLGLFNNARKNKSNSGEDIVWAAAGHQHNQGCFHWNENGVCTEILSGGGGHGSTSTSLMGFYVIGFDKDKNMIQPFSYNDTKISCVRPCGASISEEDMIKSDFYHCCNDPDAAELCQGFDTDKCDILS